VGAYGDVEVGGGDYGTPADVGYVCSREQCELSSPFKCG
jgi:hypothetical protein